MSDVLQPPPVVAPTNGDTVEPQPTAAPAERPKKLSVPIPLLIHGIGALVIWFLLFAAGLLVDTVEYRLVLAPRSVTKQLSEADFKAIVASSPLVGYLSQTPRPAGEPSPYKIVQAFFGSILCFTPINLALLTVIAGLVGGYASHIRIDTMPPEDLEKLRREHKRRYEYLQEPPMTAVMRAFIVFLCVVAGLYIAMDDPFKDPTPAQYIRLAGTLSVLAFMVGYDSSRLEDWLALVPRPSAKNGSGLDAREEDDFLRDGEGNGERGEWGDDKTRTPRRGARSPVPR